MNVRFESHWGHQFKENFMPKISGQLIIENRGVLVPNDPRAILLVFGMVGVDPIMAANFKGRKQYPVLGHSLFEDCGLSLSTVMEGQPLPDHYGFGHTVDQLLTSPIWRI
jgi:hypothetical protein